MIVKRLGVLLVAFVILSQRSYCEVSGAPVRSHGALAKYVHAYDPAYRYEETRVLDGVGYKTYVLRVTSQTWRPDDAEPSTWRHWVTLIVPDLVSSPFAHLHITGGGNDSASPIEAPEMLAYLAVNTKSIAIEVRQVPNQPLVFAGDGKSRVEDEIISYTFLKFYETGDSTWPALFPMVKSVVRAMDAVQTFSSAKLGIPIQGFVVSGASKRGWTTWLTGAVDERVVAIAPMVIDVLNMKPQMEQQVAYYGAYSEEVGDYTELGLQELIDTPEGEGLRELVDPYEYRGALKLPKLVMLGSGDQYWTVDAARLYFPGLAKPKWIFYAPNADHGMGRVVDSLKTLTAFHDHICKMAPLPKIQWDIQDDGSYMIESNVAPEELRLWTADAPTKDFRMITIGRAWSPQTVGGGQQRFEGVVPRPATGYRAFYFELVYPSGLDFNYGLSTIMTVIAANP